MEDDMTRRMAGAMIDVQHELAHRHHVAIGQPARGLERAAGDSVFAPVLGELVDPEAIRLVRTLDGDAIILRERGGPAAMIDMAVGDEQLLDGHAMLRRRRLQPRQIAARIDERAAHRRRTPDERAILLERGHGHDHGAQRWERIGHRSLMREPGAKASARPSGSTLAAERARTAR